jgi:hypothetical protein
MTQVVLTTKRFDGIVPDWNDYLRLFANAPSGASQ